MLLGLTLTLCLPLAGCTLPDGTNIFDLIKGGWRKTDRVVVDTSCAAFRPITYSNSDTSLTAQQVRAHNAAFDALCPEQGPASAK